MSSANSICVGGNELESDLINSNQEFGILNREATNKLSNIIQNIRLIDKASTCFKISAFLTCVSCDSFFPLFLSLRLPSLYWYRYLAKNFTLVIF